MPLDRYYDGKGQSVMRDMKKRYGPKKGERVFYATHNKRKKGATAKDGAKALARRA